MDTYRSLIGHRPSGGRDSLWEFVAIRPRHAVGPVPGWPPEQENDDKLGKTKYAASEAEQKDRETNERLKEAKKVFDRRRELEEQSKLQIADQV